MVSFLTGFLLRLVCSKALYLVRTFTLNHSSHSSLTTPNFTHLFIFLLLVVLSKTTLTTFSNGALIRKWNSTKRNVKSCTSRERNYRTNTSTTSMVSHLNKSQIWSRTSVSLLPAIFLGQSTSKSLQRKPTKLLDMTAPQEDYCTALSLGQSWNTLVMCSHLALSNTGH
jgi:hypothetical protein